MIAAAIVCAAALSQAANVNWGATNIKYEGAQPDAGWAVMAFYTEAGAGFTAIESAINNKKAGDLDFDTKYAIKGFGSNMVSAHDINVDALDTSKKYDFYVVVFNNAVDTAATQYAVVSALNKEYSSMDSKYGVGGLSFATASWNDIGGGVPEPTSGLLLLLGVAGLALRRRLA